MDKKPRTKLPIVAPTIIVEPQVEQPKPEPQKLNIPIPTSSVAEITAKEQLKAGNKKVVTKDGKGDVDETTSFMRTGYWLDEKSSDVFVPLNERKKLFRKIYPKGALRAKLSSSSYKSATAEAIVYRSTDDERPFASDAGAAYINDMPYTLKKKVPQVATSNAVWRVLGQAGIPMTLSEVFSLIDDKQEPTITMESIKQTLSFEDAILSEGWNNQIGLREIAAAKAKALLTNDDFIDADELIEELDEQENKILIKDEYYTEDEVVESIKEELVINKNESLAAKIVTLLQAFASLNNQTIPENGKEITKNDKEIAKNGKKTAKIVKKTQKMKFLARDKMTGHIVKQFNNRKDAALWAKVAPNSISAVISPHAKNKSAGGYIWTREQVK